MSRLRAYQTEARKRIEQAWADSHTNGLLVLPTGAGKTVVTGDTVSSHVAGLVSSLNRGSTCVIAHRQELVSQLSMALNKEGVKHRIVAPPKIIKSCVRLHMESIGRSYYDASAQTAVAGVDTLIRRESELKAWAAGVTLWVTDECFPAGTLIEGVPIEQIQVGDFVTAFNEQTGDLEKRRVSRLFKNPAPEEMVEVSIKGHHAIICTNGHPFWTQRGWVEAGNLAPLDEVFNASLQSLWKSDPYNNREPTISLSEKWKNILFKTMWVFGKRHIEIREKGDTLKNNKPSTSDASRKLYSVSDRNHHNLMEIKKVDRNGEGVLFYRLLTRILSPSFFRNNVENKPKVRIGENDSKQSYEQPHFCRKDEKNEQTFRSSPAYSGRERATSYRSRINTFVSFLGIWISTTGYCKDSGISDHSPRANTLQNRLRERIVKNSNRSRRLFPQFKSSESAGRKENFYIRKQRVESVSVLKRDDPKLTERSGFDGFVYNIEVEGLHTYTANGFIVHNCHHVLEDNKWGKATALFPNAKGLGVTATPRRADGKGLGRTSDGVFDTMIEGITMRELIDLGYLVDYRVFAPPSDLDLSQVAVSKTTGDYSHDQVVTAVRKSHIVGDVVDHYLRIAKGKRGITFATDVQTSHDIAERFNQAGVPAKAVSADTPDLERYHAVQDLASGKLLQLVNVELFGEGVDLPAVEVVSFARPTESLSLHIQQAGRALRLLLPSELHAKWESFTPEERKLHISQSEKPHAIIIDHVGNIIRHGLPDAPRKWSLDRREARGKSKPIDETIVPVRACPSCTMVYERIYKACPHCGFEPIPAGRSSPEQVDGDLMELDAETLARMRGEVDVANMTVEEKREELARKHVPYVGQLSLVKKHEARLSALNGLRDTMALWGGLRTAEGRPDSEIQRLFFHRFGIDVLSAQALSASEADQLNIRIAIDIN